MRLCADAKLAMTVGGALASTAALGPADVRARARLCAWTAAGATIGGFLGDGGSAGVPLPSSTDGGGDDIKELRRRVTKPLPRKVRKEIERIAARAFAI